MNAKDAADRLRPSFHLEIEQLAPEVQHDIKFYTDVAAELGVEPTPFNLHQIKEALEAANIHRDSNEYPKMLFSRSFPESGAVGAYYAARHDHVWVHVENDEQASALGSGWVEDAVKLPPRGDIPLYPAAKEPVAEAKPAAPEASPT